MGNRKMTDLDVLETSGVDHPAHLHEGFAVMKSSDPTKARAILLALGKDITMTTKTAPKSAPVREEIIAKGDDALAALRAEPAAKAIDSKLQAALDTLAAAWQDLRGYAESQDEATPSAGGSTEEPVDPMLAAAAADAGLDPALVKSASPELVAVLKAQGEAIAKAQERAEAAEQVAKAEQDARLDQEAIVKSRETFTNLALAHEVVAPALRKAAKVDPDLAKSIEALLINLNEQMDGAALTKEIGTPGHGGAADNSVWGEIEKQARALVESDPSLTIQKARTRVFEQNPALQAAYQKEVAR